MDITGIAKSRHADIPKASSQKEWKLSDSHREKITEYAREDAAQGVYMGKVSQDAVEMQGGFDARA